MVIINMKQLESVLMKRMESSMKEIYEKVQTNMNEETSGFYTGNTPSIYKRTFALKKTPKTTPFSVSKSEISFSAYLDERHRYKSGAKPTMTDILNLTKATPEHNSSVGYLRSVRGKIGFWERSIDKMSRDFNETLRKTFK